MSWLTDTFHYFWHLIEDSSPWILISQNARIKDVVSPIEPA